MKQARRILPALAVLAFLCVFCTLLTAAADVVTVSTSAELSSAVSTLSATGGTIRFAGNIALSSSLSLPKNSARITIDGDGYTLRMNGNLALNGDMDVKNICFYNIGTYRSIPCGGHDVHFYDTVTCGKSGDYYPSIMAGYTASAAFTGGRLTVDGGTWQRIRGGNAGTGSVLQSGSVVINGGSITEFLQICGAGASAPGSRFDVTVNGGSIASIRFFSVSGSAASTADAALTVNGGRIGGTLRLSIFDSSTLNGESTIRLLGGDFSGLTGIYGYAGSGSLRTSLILSPSLTGVIENRITDTLSGTLLRTGVADPCLLYTNGLYYLTMTGSSNIALLRSTSLDGLGSLTLSQNLVYRGAQDTTATDTFGYTTLSGTWSPELHYFDADDFGADYAGWYMFLALRKKGDDSSNIRMVALKSKYGETPEGPYRHPTDGTTYKSQPILDRSGSIITEWGCGMSILRIESGAYKGIYAMWVAEENRGTAAFRQKVMIARLKSPWQLETEPTAILTPTQYWETIGSGYDDKEKKYFPAVVEGATALYGKDGQVYVIYCGSGYWTNYGLGQITWNGGDPQSASSWVKYTDNPVFGANDKNGNHYSGVMMQGAGHAFFVRDAEDSLYAVYHAYPSDADGSNKASARNAYIEPCFIDYTKFNGANYGVLTFANGKKPANTSMKVSFTTRLSASSLLDLFDDSFDAAVTLDAAASLSAEPADGGVLLRASYKADGIEGCEIRRKVDGGAFVKLTDLTGGDREYTDTATEANAAYAYIALPYMEHGGTRYYGAPSDEATAEVRLDPPTLKVDITTDSKVAILLLSHPDTTSFSFYRIYKYDAAEGAGTKTLLAEIKANRTSWVDTEIELEHTYIYSVTAVKDGFESAPSAEQRLYVPIPRMTATAKTAVGGGILLTITDSGSADSYEFKRYDDGKVLSNTKDKTCLDTDVVPGTQYTYLVTAYENGESVYRISAFCTAAKPKASLRISEKNGRITLTVSEVSGAASYKLYQDGSPYLSGNLVGTSQFANPWDDGKYVFRLDVLDEDGRVFDSVTQTLRIGVHYDKAYDTNGDGVCDIRDALLSLQNVLNGKGGTLADILNLLRFLAD